MNCLFVLFFLFAVSQGSSLENTKNMEERFMDLPFGGFLDPMTGNLTSRIIGGTDATPGEFAYQVSLQIIKNGKRFHGCGGSILSPNKIATAAHCCNAVTPSALKIVAGAQNMLVAEPSQQVRNVLRITIHDNYDKSTLNNDACKLFLSESLNLDKTVATIPLCRSEPTSGICIATGWGTTSTIGNVVPNTLQKVNLDIVTRSICTLDYTTINPVTNGMICAGTKDGEGGCIGDSGGPLVCGGGNGGEKCLAGATSWGVTDPCAQARYPTVYVNVAYFHEFYSSDN